MKRIDKFLILCAVVTVALGIQVAVEGLEDVVRSGGFHKVSQPHNSLTSMDAVFIFLVAAGILLLLGGATKLIVDEINCRRRGREIEQMTRESQEALRLSQQ